MAYGFNDDKSKSALIKSMQVTPTSGETWVAFAERLWSILNGLNHVLCVHSNFMQTYVSEEPDICPSAFVPYKYSSDSIPTYMMLPFPYVDGGNARMGYLIIHSSEIDNKPSYYWGYYQTQGGGGGVNRYTGGSPTAAAKGIAGGDLYFKIDYIP